MGEQAEKKRLFYLKHTWAPPSDRRYFFKSGSTELGIFTFFWTLEWFWGKERLGLGRSDEEDDDVLLSVGWDTTEFRTHQKNCTEDGGGEGKMGTEDDSETSHLNSKRQHIYLSTQHYLAILRHICCIA